MTEEQNPTPAPEGKSTQTKLAAAVIAGYVLGRTKKGGAALALASWLSGNQVGPQAMSLARKGLTQVAQSEQAAQIMKQVRGPLMEAAQKAATQAVLSRVTAISDGLTARAQALSEVGGTTVEGTAETVKGTAETVKGTAETVSDTTKKAGGGVKGTAETVSDTTKKAGGGVKGTAETVSDTTKKAGGGVKGAVGKLTGRKKGKAEEPKAKEEKLEDESREGSSGTG
ncbi:MAG: hypothetical protein ACJ72M_12280 [Propionibacteriaceae bacterium]